MANLSELYSSNLRKYFVSDMHMLNELLLNLIVFSPFFGVRNERDMGLAVAGGKEVGTACCSGGVGVENELERGVSQEEQDRERFPLGVTGSSVD